jgi:hypothetical protein
MRSKQPHPEQRETTRRGGPYAEGGRESPCGGSRDQGDPGHGGEEEACGERSVPQHLLEVERQDVEPGDADHGLQRDRGVGDHHVPLAKHEERHERRGRTFLHRHEGDQEEHAGGPEAERDGRRPADLGNSETA